MHLLDSDHASIQHFHILFHTEDRSNVATRVRGSQYTRNREVGDYQELSSHAKRSELDYESDRSSDLERGLTRTVKLDITLVWEYVASPVFACAWPLGLVGLHT